jgi:hypothetical protein
MKKNSKRKWKSISLKVQHLQLELEEREELLRQYEEEFLKKLTEALVEDAPPANKPVISVPPPANNSTLNQEVEDIMDAPPPADGPEEMKQLWRSIAIATHPDKTQGDEHKAELYKRAGEAWRSGKYNELYKIALELDIEPPDTDVTYTVLEEITVDLEKKISEKEKSILWEWGRAKDDQKHKIMDLYLASKGKKRKNKG